MLNFDFLERVFLGQGIDSPSHFVYDFVKNIVHVIFYNWPNFIVWLPLLLEILGIMCIVIVC